MTEPKQGDRAKGKQVDSWKVSEDGKELLRVHRKPRKGLFSPAGVLPLKFGSARVDVQVAVLPKGGAHTPLLLSKEFLKWIGAIIDTDTDTLVCKKIGQRIPLAETERGHYAIPVLPDRAGMTCAAPVTGSTANSKKGIPTAHCVLECSHGPRVRGDHPQDDGEPEDQRGREERGSRSRAGHGRCDRRQRRRAVDPNTRDDENGMWQARQDPEADHGSSLQAGQELCEVGQGACDNFVRRGHAEAASVRGTPGQQESRAHEEASPEPDEREGQQLQPGAECQRSEGQPDEDAPEECRGADPDEPDGSSRLAPSSRGAEGTTGCHQGPRRGDQSSGGQAHEHGGTQGVNQAPRIADPGRKRHGVGAVGAGDLRRGQRQDQEEVGRHHERCSPSRADSAGQCSQGHPRGAKGDECPQLEELMCSLQSLESRLTSCDVAMVQMGVDISEVFSVPRISQTAKAVGLNPGKCYDIANGFDLSRPQVRKQVLEELSIARPKLVVICPPCDQYSSLCDMSGYKGSAAWVRKMLKAKVLLRFATQIAEKQVKQGNLFLFEHPHAARSWGDRHVQRLGRNHGVGSVAFDQCMFGLADVQSGERHRKRTRVMCNSEHVLRELDRTCSGDHRHERLLGRVKHEGMWLSRSRLAQKYPEEMCKAVVRGLLKEKQANSQSVVQHHVCMLESLGESESDARIMRTLRRCHENLGHPSTAKLISMLKSAHATDRVLKLAKGLQCPTCQQESGVKSRPVATTQGAKEFNQVVGMDTFEVELPWRKLKMLNVVDMATRYQVCVPLWKGVDARCARVAYRRYWKRWAGSPVKAWTDAGPEFGEYFTSALEGDGTWHEVTASHSPWQNGVVERHGGAWKVAFNKALLGLVLESKMEVEELCDQITQAHNTMTRKGGYSPSQHVFGSEQRVPGLVLTGVHDDVVESGLAVGESAYERRHAIRTAARNAFIDAENEERLKRAAAHRTRPKDGPLSVGELVLVWRKSVGEKKPHWHGPGHVLGVQGSRIWVAHATKVYRCSPEQVKRLSQEQESLVRLLPDDLRTCRNQLRERGAGNIVELDGRDVPPPNFRDGAEGQDEAGEASEEAVAESGPVATQVDGHAEVSASGDAATEVVAEQPPNMEVDTEELVPEEPLLEHGAVDVAMGPQQRERVGSEPEPHGEPETAGVPVGTVTVRKMPEASYGPQRPISELTRAMRASLRNLDFGRPIREGTPEVGDDELLVEEVLVTEEVCVAEAKRRRKSEVSEQELARHEKENLHVSKAAEWNKMLETRSVKVHVGEAAEQLINEVGKDRLLSSRFVITRSDDAEKLKKGLVKARWCIRGYLDPDLLELDTAAPTLSPEGLAVVLQVLATKKWDLCIGDVEAAFLRGDDIERPRGRVLVRVPPGGIPGVPEGAVIELLKPVYGLADAPKAWHRSFTQALAKLGCVASKLDQCVYFCRSSDGVLQGIIALHVDDMACGGTQWFHDSVLRRLREAFPFKHFKKKAGDFLGRFLQQGEDFSIHVSQKEYAENLECIKVSRDRRKQRDAEVTEEERKQMRAALGELNWLVSSSRPDLAAFCSLLQQRVNKALVRDLIEVNRAVAMARDFCNMEVVVRHIPEQEVEFCVWSDASWANATEKKSQGGYVIAAVPSSLRKGSWATFSPLRWKSYKQDRQVASTLGAELLALSRALAEAKWVRSMWSEAMNANYTLETNDKWAVQIPITACLDSKPVYDHIHGQLMTIRDKRLAIEMLLVKQDVASDNVATRWMPTYQMLADSMTKCGAPMALLRRTIREGKTVLVEDDEIKRWAAKK